VCGWRNPGMVAPPAILIVTDSMGNPILAEDWWGRKGGFSFNSRFEQVIEDDSAPASVMVVGSGNRRFNGGGDVVDSDVMILQRQLLPLGFRISVLGETTTLDGNYGIVESGKSIAKLADGTGWAISGSIEANCIVASTACGPIGTLYRDVLAMR